MQMFLLASFETSPLIFLSPLRVSPFLAWGDFHARSSFAGSTIPEKKWGTTRSLDLAERSEVGDGCICRLTQETCQYRLDKCRPE